MFDHKDGGIRSRKMVMAYVTVLLITGGFLATGVWPALHVAYGEFVMGVLAAASIYAGGNTAVKWMSARAATSPAAAPPPAAKPPPGGPKASAREAGD